MSLEKRTTRRDSWVAKPTNLRYIVNADSIGEFEENDRNEVNGDHDHGEDVDGYSAQYIRSWRTFEQASRASQYKRMVKPTKPERFLLDPYDGAYTERPSSALAHTKFVEADAQINSACQDLEMSLMQSLDPKPRAPSVVDEWPESKL